VKLKSGRVDRGLTYPLDRLGNILQPNARIDQHQSSPALHQQTMTSSPLPRRRLQNSAISVANLHLIPDQNR